MTTYIEMFDENEPATQTAQPIPPDPFACLELSAASGQGDELCRSLEDADFAESMLGKVSALPPPISPLTFEENPAPTPVELQPTNPDTEYAVHRAAIDGMLRMFRSRLAARVRDVPDELWNKVGDSMVRYVHALSDCHR